MKRLIKTVDLVFFRDDANGEYGLTHKETFDNNYGNGFNAFWGGMGIFHDVFEHAHEHTNKYFRGDYAMNIGGEMAAMGAMFYYMETLGMHNRIENMGWNWRGTADAMKRTTLDEIHEAISSGWCNYGYTLESNVPRQKPVYVGDFEYEIESFAKEVKAFPVDGHGEQEKEFGEQYKKSVTFRKIADLHRYGYRMAEKLVPDNWDNRAMLENFIAFWNNFCKRNSAEDMQQTFSGLTVKLYKDENGFISWKAILKSSSPSEIMDVVITEKTTYFSIEDLSEYYVDLNY